MLEVNEIAMREGEKGIDTFEPFNPECMKHCINTGVRRAIVCIGDIRERFHFMHSERVVL